MTKNKEYNPPLTERGIDYDLEACLEYNPQTNAKVLRHDGFVVTDIAMVLAVFEGERDQTDWRWILELEDRRIIFLQGGCDYTGWDCHSWATATQVATPEEAVELAISPSSREDYEVHASLLIQLKEGKAKTWRERKDEEFGLTGDEPMSGGVG